MPYPRPMTFALMARPITLVLIVSCAALAAPTFGQPAAAKPPPELPSTTTPDNTRYLHKPSLLVGCQREVDRIQSQPCDVIFIGDSITARWLIQGKAVWEKYYSGRHPLDFGVGGDKTQDVLWRLEHMAVQGLRPKVAVVMIGTNNMKYTPEEIAAGVRTVIDRTQATFPGVKTILVSILPNRRANAKMMAADAIIRDYADNRSIYYLDLVPLMPPAGDNWKGLGPDHLHPDASGYEIWAAAMEPLLARLLKG